MEIYKLSRQSETHILMATIGLIAAGEPAETESLFERVDLNTFIMKGSEDVYMIRASGDSMETEIKHGDWLIINRALQAKNGDKILACVGNSYTVKIFSSDRNGLSLVSSNGKYAPRRITKRDDFVIFGVVIGIYRDFKKI